MRPPRSGFGHRGRPFVDVPSERRTRRDLLTAGIIAVAVVLFAVVVIVSGSAARSGLRAAGADQPVYGPAVEPPTTLQPLWSHDSGGTGAPLTTKGNLVTVSPDGPLVGRDAGSGEERWAYSHAGRFCAAAFYADALVAAFDGASGCSDVTALDPTAQQYKSTRQSHFPDTMELRSTWRHALALSPERLEIWRDDLVRTVEYGEVDAPQEAGMQPRTGCTLVTAGLTDERFAVTERCPDDDSVRLTLSATVPKDNRKPEDIASAPTGADGLWIIEVSDAGVLALEQRGTAWTVEWYTSPTEHSTIAALGAEPALKPSPDTVTGDTEQARWFDGETTRAFDVSTGRLSWKSDGSTGPGLTGGWSPDPAAETVMNWVLMPVEGGIALLDHDTGRETRRLPSTSPRTDGVTGLAQIGDILYERGAGTIYAYKLIA